MHASNQKVIGLSVSPLEQAYRPNILPVDYNGVGAIFPMQGKIDANIIGINTLAAIKDISVHPVVAIGGINSDNIKQVREVAAD